MKTKRFTFLCLCTTIVLAACSTTPAPASEATLEAQLVNDRNITLTSAAQIFSKRQALRNFIWGTGGFPGTKQPSSFTLGVCNTPAASTLPASDVCSFRATLPNLKSVNELRMAMGNGVEGLAYHFVANQSNGRLVIINPGHACTLDNPVNPSVDSGYQIRETIAALLKDGYSVLGTYMPGLRPDACIDNHATLINTPLPTGSGLKFFLETFTVGLNYLQTQWSTHGFPHYSEYDMIGLSGGGWSTAVYSALDTRITKSFDVAGSMPLYLRSGGSVGDKEQYLDAFYTLAGYPDLYIMGSYGVGRRRVQILNRNDNCCFGQAQHIDVGTGDYNTALRAYEIQVRSRLYDIGALSRVFGMFRLEIDEAAPEHLISQNTLFNIILPELNGGRRSIGAAGTETFVRGMNGHLWHRDNAITFQDTGIDIVGTPAVLQNAVNTFDVFFRSTTNSLKHASWNSATGWAVEDLGGTILNDPVAISWGAGRWDVVAMGVSYKFFHWNSAQTGFTLMHNTAKGYGMPTLVHRGVNKLSLVFRGFNHQVQLLNWNGSAWALENVGGAIRDFPTAVYLGGILRIYARLNNNLLSEATKNSSGVWQWTSLSSLTLSTATKLAGTPSATVQAGVIKVFTRTATNRLVSFQRSSAGTWTFRDHATPSTDVIYGSPVAIPPGAYARGAKDSVWLFNGSTWTTRGGVFD
jgi:hypothetical protein